MVVKTVIRGIRATTTIRTPDKDQVLKMEIIVKYIFSPSNDNFAGFVSCSEENEYQNIFLLGETYTLQFHSLINFF